MFFSPLSLLFFLLFFILSFIIFTFIHIGLITIAFERIGLTESQTLAFLILSLIGSSINIPVKKIKSSFSATGDRQVRFFGMTYNVPRKSQGHTLVALNLGGAVVPFFLSCYLMLKNGIFFEPVVATAFVGFLTYFLARPVSGVGIAMPMFIPPLIAAIVTLLLGPSRHAPAVAYIAATMGTLIGADILHLKDIEEINAPLVSIGGAGTFDGIFLAGIIAVILA